MLKKIVASLIAITAVSCGSAPQAKLKAGETAPATDSVSELSRGINKFSFELYKQVTRTPELAQGNVFLSPASVSAAFGMTYVGAKGATATEMASVLGYPAAPSKIGDGFQKLLAAWNADKDKDGYQLKIANRIWAQKGFGFLPAFMAVNKKEFLSSVGEVDFRDAAGRKLVVDEINQWASDNTNGKITQVVKEDDVEDATRIMLANAIYFMGDWVLPFRNPGDAVNRERPFKRVGKEATKATFMSHAEPIDHVRYYEDGDLQAVELPYRSKDGAATMAMTILLPRADDGIKGLEATLDGNRFGKIIDGMRMVDGGSFRLAVQLPKWELKSDVMALIKPLQALGLKRPFRAYNPANGDGADFSGMTGSRNIFLDRVLHKTFIRVDEKGTEAAAVTVIGGVMATSVPVMRPVKSFVADHPFMYAIRDVKTNTVLFVGRLMDPSLTK